MVSSLDSQPPRDGPTSPSEHRSSSQSTPSVPLLNQYKHALFRRRVLQTLTGGVKIRKAPCYIHLIQSILWTAPFLLALPFIVISSLGVWNFYYIALVYAALQGINTLSVEAIGVLVRYRHKSNTSFGAAQLDDEDSVDFELDSCCSYETFNFVFARKKLHSLFLHPFISGLVSFAGCFVLQPGVMLESMHIAGVVFVSIFGWYSFCSAHYSLSVSPPQETANYRPTDPLDLRFLTRPFYIVAIAATFIPLRLLLLTPTVTPYLLLLYSSLCLLPLAWLIGFLPPLDALLPWIMEQGLTRLMGGSPMATDLRLLLMFMLSSISVTIVTLLNNITLSVLLATTFGFLLSQDIFTLFKTPLYLLSLITRCAKRLSSIHYQLTTKTFISLCGWDFKSLSTLKTLAIHYAVAVLKGAALLGASLVIVYFTLTSSGKAEEFGTRISAGFVIGVYFLLRGSQILQRVYIFGILRNPFFPKQCENVAKFHKRRKLLYYFSIPGGLIQTYLSPLLMLSFVGFSLKTPTNMSSSIPKIWCVIVSARILRKVWQDSSSALFEVTVVAFLYFVVPVNNLWTSLGSGTQTLIIGICAKILQDFFQKLWFVGTMFGNFLFKRKHRTYLPLTVTIIVGTFVFLPILFLLIFLSSVFSSPLLPLFTLPIFSVSFPRTKRFWPSLINYASSYSKCQESIYYQQSEAEIARVLHRSILSGSISATPGAYLLLRFEDRLCLVTFLEHGYGHCVLAIKGLELQETSCHSVEATRIDTIFEDAYQLSSKSCFAYLFNTHFSNTLQPVDAEVVMVYSDARNVLTGIIDQPSSLQRFPDNLQKCLVWIFFQHFISNSEMSKLPENNEVTSDKKIDAVEMDSRPKSNHESRCVVEAQESESICHRSRDVWSEEKSADSLVHSPNLKAGCAEQTHHNKDDIISWSDSISSFDDALSPPSENLNTDHVAVYTLAAVDSLPGLIPQDKPLNKVAIVQHRETTTVDLPLDINDDIIPSDVRLSSIPMSEIHRHQQAYELKTSDGIPSRWTEELPLRHSQLSDLRSRFPMDWLEFLMRRHHAGHLSNYLKEKLIDLVLICFALVDVETCSKIEGRRVEGTKPFDVFEGFCGQWPSCVHSDWLNRDSLLKSLLLKAYRYAVKLMYDEVSLGEVDNWTELAEYLASYDSDYFIGPEDDNGWAGGVVEQVPHLFSLGRDSEKNVYTAHVLSLQPHVLHIAQLNPAAIHGIWSDLSFELLYLTNDDEERYSIQAHPTLLRNLTIQAADPPLGYYIYSSGILRTPST